MTITSNPQLTSVTPSTTPAGLHIANVGRQPVMNSVPAARQHVIQGVSASGEQKRFVVVNYPTGSGVSSLHAGQQFQAGKFHQAVLPRGDRTYTEICFPLELCQIKWQSAVYLELREVVWRCYTICLPRIIS